MTVVEPGRVELYVRVMDPWDGWDLAEQGLVGIKGPPLVEFGHVHKLAEGAVVPSVRFVVWLLAHILVSPGVTRASGAGGVFVLVDPRDHLKVPVFHGVLCRQRRSYSLVRLVVDPDGIHCAAEIDCRVELELGGVPQDRNVVDATTGGRGVLPVDLSTCGSLVRTMLMDVPELKGHGESTLHVLRSGVF